MSKHRSYCFTLNNYTEAECELLRQLGGYVKYLVFGREVAPDTGTPHLQGYVTFNSPATLAAAKRKISPRAHLEPAKGSAADNFDYCSKDKDFEEFGVRPIRQPGKRTDLEDVKQAILDGKTLAEAILEGKARSYQGIKMYDFIRRKIYRRPAMDKPELVICIGPSGTGKTSWAEQYLGDYENVPSAGIGWFEGVDNCENVIFDDLRIKDRNVFALFLQMFNRNPKMQLPVKGGFVDWSCRRAVITCLEIEDIRVPYEKIYQLLRRADRILKFDVDFTYDDVTAEYQLAYKDQ